MKRIRALALLLSLLTLLTILVAPAASALQEVSYALPKDTALSAKAAMVVHLSTSADRDMILYKKDTDRALAPAGLVRIMVGLTALDISREKNLNLDTATGTYTDACFQAIAGTGIPTAGMETGDVWTLRDLLTISIIQSAGDTLETLVFTLCGSEAAFVQRMNQKAQAMGCAGTLFKNATGNEAAGQVTTAMDVYRMLRAAMDEPELQTMLSLTFYDAKPKKGTAITLPTTNNLLRAATDSYYEPALLGRSGWSEGDGPAVAAVARSDGYEYMVIVLGAAQKTDNDHFTDAKKLFRWAYGDFSLTTLRTKNDPIASVAVQLCWEQDQLQLVPQEDFTAVVPDTLDPDTITVKTTDVPEQVDAPVSKGQAFGRVAFYTPDGQKIGDCDLVADQSLSRSHWLFVWHYIGRFFSSGWFWGGFLLLLALCVGYVLLTIQHNKQRRREHQKKVRPYK